MSESRWRFCSALMLLTGGIVTLVAMFHKEYVGGSRVADYSELIWYQVPALVALPASALLVAGKRTFAVGVGLALAFNLIWLNTHVENLGNITTGGFSASAGLYLRFAGAALGLVGALIATWRLSRSGALHSGGSRVVPWVLAAGVLGLAHAAGYVMPFIQENVLASATDYTFVGTGTNRYAESCCTLIEARGWQLASQIVLVVMVLSLPALFAVQRNSLLVAGAFAGIGLALLADPLHALASLAQPATRTGLGMALKQAREAKAIFAHHGLPGLWLSIGTAMAFLPLGVARSVVRVAEEADRLPPSS